MKHFFTIFFVYSSLIFAVNPNQSTESATLNAAIEHVIWDGNRISTIHGNQGDVVSDDVTSASGFEWPKGSGKRAIFQAGHWLASGKVRAPGGGWIEEIRTAAAEYTQEYVPGKINGDGQSGHIYRINRKELHAFLENDYSSFSSMTLELPVSIIEGSQIYSELVTTALPSSDFMNWPVAEGAPWVDANGDGSYNPEDGDHPSIIGDMFHWYIMNDADSSGHQPLWNTNPMNVEVQVSMFGFDREGPLGDMLFIRQVITNRGPDDLDSVFISFWHDDDLGDAGDDLVGCDVDLNLGYTYNDPSGDMTYGVAVPAVGSVFHQGPLVVSPGDTARVLTWDLQNDYHFKIIPDYILRPMTAFHKIMELAPDYRDPNSALDAFRSMNGEGYYGDQFTNPVTGEKTPFAVPGNPVAAMGWIDGHWPGSRRYNMSSGPFTLMAGDNQEIVSSIIVAGGQAWDKSIAKLRAYSLYAQQDFNSLFSTCEAPVPEVASVMLENRVVLSWENNSAAVESYNCSGFSFQGYNVYQMTKPDGPWTRIATYDVSDGYRIIYSGVIDDVTGEVIHKPVQDGTDSGLKHYIELDRDLINDKPLVNNRTYFFAVTAYIFDPDPDVTFACLESPKTAIRVIPGSAGVGTQFEQTYADTLEVSHIAGNATGAQFFPLVVDPYQLTGHTYQISFPIVNDSTSYWALVDLNEDDTLAFQDKFPVTAEYYESKYWGHWFIPEEIAPTIRITDGFLLTTEKATYMQPTEPSGYTVISDQDTLTPLVFQWIVPTALASDIGDGSWNAYLSNIPGLSQADGSPGPDDMQKDIQFRFTDVGSIATYLNNFALMGQPSDTVWLPFEMWTVEPGDTQQVNVSVYQIAGSKPIFGVGSTSGGTMIIKNVAFMPVYEPYNRDSVLANPLRPDGSDGQKMGWMLQFNKEKSIFESGNVLQVHFDNRLIPGEDVYTFIAIGAVAETEAKKIKDQISQINVFPNPYFGGFNNVHYPDDRYVYFTNLGVGKTTIRIFTLSGDLVARIEKVLDSPNDADRHARWDLHNSFGKQVANGIYIVHITVEDTQGKKLGERILKLAVARTVNLY